MPEFNYLLLIFLSVYLFQAIFDVALEKVNVNQLKRKGSKIPKSFSGFIDTWKLSKINRYTLERSRLGLVEGLVSDALLLVIILSGFMPAVDRLFSSWHLLLSGLCFFLVPSALLYAAGLPFDYYHTFNIEEKFGFNRSTLQIWLTDHLKSGLISLVLSSALLVLILWIIQVWPQRWWIWGFLAVSLVQITLALLYPILIAPIFNKFKPIEDELLAEKIRRLMKANGIEVKSILQMNAGLRSRHTNAYFTGFGKTKRIVLFDTLLESHPHQEILAVLAHEVGHFRKKHILKQLLIFEISMLIVFYLTYRMLDWPLLYSTFGFSSPKSYVGLFFIGIFWQKVGFFAKPLYMALSRHFERQADQFAVKFLHAAEPLTTALKRMAADNLANLTPHSLYVWFNYSHPPLVERVASLDRKNYEDRSF